MNNTNETPNEKRTREVFNAVGAAVQQLRQYNGLSIDEAAERLEMTPAKVAAIERGTMYNNIPKLARIVEALRGRLAIVPEEDESDPHCQFIEFDND